MQDRMMLFREKFEELVAVSTPFSSHPMATHLVPRDGKSREFEDLKKEVAYLAGLAEPGIVETNTHINTTSQGGQTVRLSPVAAWLAVTQPRPPLTADDVTAAAAAAEGRLQVQKEERERTEGTLAWKISKIIGWPAKVRELAGFSQGSVAGKATVWSLSAVLFALTTGVAACIIFALIFAVGSIRILGT